MFRYCNRLEAEPCLPVFLSTMIAVCDIPAISLCAAGETYREGPVRFAPVIDAGRVYVASDDGYVYAPVETRAAA